MVSAVAALVIMVSAVVLAAVFPMVVAIRFGAIRQRAGQQSLNRGVSLAAYAGIERNAGFLQRHARTAPDASAN